MPHATPLSDFLRHDLPDEDEDDEDYVPPQQDAESSSDSEPEDSNTPDAKRARTVDETQVDGEQQKLEKERADALYASFLATSEEGTRSTGASEVASSDTTFKVRIEKRYLFAGKEVVEVVEVLADSKDAQQWPHVGPEALLGLQTEAQLEGSSTSGDTPSSVSNDSSSRPTLSASSTSTSSAALEPKKPPPKRRKATTLLSSDSDTLSVPQPLKKLTTLAKSRMDWTKHLHSQGGEDRTKLEANRKEGGGGYLERVQFLERVDERREGLLEDSKGRKRKR